MRHLLSVAPSSVRRAMRCSHALLRSTRLAPTGPSARRGGRKHSSLRQTLHLLPPASERAILGLRAEVLPLLVIGHVLDVFVDLRLRLALELQAVERFLSGLPSHQD